MEIINASLLVGESFELWEEGHLVIENGKITELGEGYVSDGQDYSNYLVMPSLINAHTHIGDSFAKEGVLGLTANEAVGPDGKKWRLYEGVREEKIDRAMRDSLEYMLNSGITAFMDFREGGKEGARLFREATRGFPIRSILLGRNLNLNECNGLGLNVLELGQIPPKKERKGKIIAIHAGEEEGEIAMALRCDPDIIVHFTKATGDDIKIAAQKNIAVIICPRANAVLGVGFPPVREMLKEGINVSLGTDNVMINSPNLFREMEFLGKVSPLYSSVAPKEILRMVTVNPAKMLELNSGVIARGKRADLIFIDKNAKNIKDNKNLIAALVHRCEPENVRKVMMGGKMIVDKK